MSAGDVLCFLRLVLVLHRKREDLDRGSRIGHRGTYIVRVRVRVALIVSGDYGHRDDKKLDA